MFRGLLTLKEQCEACGADFSMADAADGPSFFVMFAALIVIVPAAMLLELGFSPPVWVHIVLWPPVTLVFCLLLLRPFKGVFFAMQWKHKALEARFGQRDET